QGDGGSPGRGGVAARARDGETALGELGASGEVLTVDVDPAQRVQCAREIRLVAALLGQRDGLTEYTQRALVVAEARAGDAFGPQAPGQRNDQAMLSRDARALGRHVPTLGIASEPVPERADQKAGLPLSIEVVHFLAD